MRALRSGASTRRAILAALGLAVIALAIWMRQSVNSSAEAAERSADRAAMLSDVRRTIGDELERLRDLADAGLRAPPTADSAFRFLASLPNDGIGESIVLYDSAVPRAWAGHVRIDPSGFTQPVNVSSGPFFTTLSVVRALGSRRAIASAVISALPPAGRLSGSIQAAAAARWRGLRIVPPTTGAALDSAPRSSRDAVLSIGGQDALVAAVAPASAAELRFERSVAVRERAALLLVLAYLVLIFIGWRSRHKLAERLAVVGVGIIATGLFPWSEFSNQSRLFDPGFYFSRIGGPFTANAAAFLASSILALMAAVALARARPRIRWSPVLSGIGCVVLLGVVAALASNLVRGVGQPAWGSTPGLWLSWEVPLFLLLLAFLIVIAMLARSALGTTPTPSVRTAATLALVAAIAASMALWASTTRERMRLAERDVASLTRSDDYEEVLLRRFVAALERQPSPANAAQQLRVYAGSELSAAEFPVLLETTSPSGLRSRLDLASAAIDSLVLTRARSDVPVGNTTTVLGPTGVQLVGTARHTDGGSTVIAALPHTQLVSPPPFAALLGLARPASGDPPYTVLLADVNPGLGAGLSHMRWTRIGNVWHGDRLLPTSAGLRRAHVEIDIRSFEARGERALLIILLDVLIGGLIWMLGAMAERPFPRWLRVRSFRWVRTYRGRLTLALFAFFVVPAAAFAVWSYQRLRSDDRRTRELLINETLQTIAGDEEKGDLAVAERRFDTPLFSYHDGFLVDASDALFGSLPPGGIALPPPVQMQIELRGEITAAWQQSLAGVDALFGYRAVLDKNEKRFVLAAPARSDELVLDRRRRDLGILVLFLTALGGVAALWLSGVAAKRLARDLELSRIEVARAERVIAWGEMARQVAHEIKNPLTPIRLGVQHLRRARRDDRGDFDKVLDENVGRILSEIDRLDAIARSFSRYGSAPADLPPAERTDAAAVLRDVVALEQMGQGDVKWKLRGTEHGHIVMARADELREVFLNVLENARLAGAKRVEIRVAEEERRVTIEVLDDGSGIPQEVLPRLFEPHFSTRTTGSGLGLAASRRIIEHWGGEIVIGNREERGTRVLIALVRAT